MKPLKKRRKLQKSLNRKEPKLKPVSVKRLKRGQKQKPKQELKQKLRQRQELKQKQKQEPKLKQGQGLKLKPEQEPKLKQELKLKQKLRQKQKLLPQQTAIIFSLSSDRKQIHPLLQKQPAISSVCLIFRTFREQKAVIFLP